jgi:hypothetical protein
MAKTRGILFYANGTAPLPLLVAALFSLRQQYKGLIHVIYGDEVPPWIRKEIEDLNDVSSQLSKTRYQGKAGLSGRRKHWNVRPMVHKESPFDVSLMYDCDHVFVSPFDDSVFDYLEQHGIGSCNKSWEQLRWHHQAKAQVIAQSVSACFKEPCDLLLPCNGGCVGTTRDARGLSLIDEWLHYMDLCGLSKDPHLLSKYNDQHALSFVMYKHGVPMCSRKYSHASDDTGQSDLGNLPPDIMAIHFAHFRYGRPPADRFFGKALADAMAADYMKIFSRYAEYEQCNGTIAHVIGRQAHPVFAKVKKREQN